MVCQFFFFAYISFQLVRSSAKCQVKCFLGCSFKGYTNIDEAIATWDYAVANDIVGERRLGNVTGYPGVFQGNPCLYLSKPVPVHKGMGFKRYGSRVGYNPRVSKPIRDRNAGSY